MSLLTGGTADKLGNRYEDRWMILQFIRAIDGEIDSIRIEDPTADKSECLIRSAKGDELHQNKRSKASGSWTLNQLGSNHADILSAVFRQLDGNNSSFYFVSGSDSPELKALTDQARLVSDFTDYKEKVLSTKTHENSYNALLKEWGITNDEKALNILKRVYVRVIDEEGILTIINSKLRALFLSNHGEIRRILQEIITNNIGVNFTGVDIRNKIKALGHRFRAITDADSALRKVNELTDQYITETRRRLIAESLIPRDISGKIVDRILSATGQTDTLLVSDAGGGKSVCLTEISETLRASEITVLTFRLDRLKPTTTSFKLGEQLGLEESPSFVLSNLESNRTAVLVIDQLDAVSTASGRYSEYIYAVESIIEDIKALKRKKPIHVILACRKFDLNNDHRLRKLITQKNSLFKLGDFSLPEVQLVLKTLPIDHSLLNDRQLKLLARPQNLSLFSQLREYSESVTSFGSTKDLFDTYWNEKRMAVAKRFGKEEDYWSNVIDFLAREMTNNQQLSVAKECLDEFPPKYIEQLISENVLSLHSGRYGFGHESFFDYCYARRFIRKNESLVTVLITSEQHLFRRAQVRQILAYLRDSDHQKYTKELETLLKSSEIRIHIKDLALSILVAVPSVSESEWLIIEPWIDTKLTKLKKEKSEAFADLVWQHFFHSNSWFTYAYTAGLPAKWLNSDSEKVINVGVNYLRRHQKENASVVAELLTPFKDESGIWRDRLKGIMQWADLEQSRSFFDLFLDLVSNGCLDEAKGPIAVNSTFWDMIYNLDKVQPSWVIELLIVWIRRRIKIIQDGMTEKNTKPNWENIFPSGQSGVKTVSKAIELCPEETLKNLLPLSLELAELGAYEGDNLPVRDAVWGYFLKSNYPDLRQIIHSSICASLNKTAKNSPQDLEAVVSNLSGRQTYFSNKILLGIFTAGAEYFADQALALLENEPWRFRCGYSDSSYWTSRCLVGAIAPNLSHKRMKDLEDLVLGYRSTWEQTKSGYKYTGDAIHSLSGSIPKNLLSKAGQKKLKELARKFGDQEKAPRGITGGAVVSPISSEAEEKMTDDQWRTAIQKYSASDRERFSGDFLKGGAYELAGSMKPFIIKEPERFAELALSLPKNTNSVYFDYFLMSFEEAKCPVDLKLNVAKKAFQEHKLKCGRWIASLLGSIDERLDDEFIEMLNWLAIKHPNPKRELWKPSDTDPTEYYGGSISDCGLNSDRGRAVIAIADLIKKDEEYIQRFSTTISLLSEEKTLSVKASAIRVSYEIIRHDKDRAIELFLDITKLDPRLLAIHYSDHFLAWAIQQEFSTVESSLLVLLRSSEEKESKVGARLLALAKLYSQRTDSYIEEALNGSPPQRKGVAEVAAKNIGLVDSREWCEKTLIRLFLDSDSSVRDIAASSFRELEEKDLSQYNQLIRIFSESLSFKSNSSSLMSTLEKTKYRLPELTMVVCENFILQISPENTRAFSQNYVDSSSLGTLVFRIYQQYQSEPLSIQALDLIDEMIISGLGEPNQYLNQFER
ncbi:MAG: hypothetical protein ACSHX6_14325 [Akkermansiaceae bacterium]